MSYSVDELLKTPFERRSLEEKLKIKLSGRPTPNLNIQQDAKKSKTSFYKRNFNRQIYEEVWICGCGVRNSLFCFPCLLFSGETSWSKSGVRDLGHMKEYIRRHSKNKKHMSNVLNLTDIGKINIATQLDSAYRLSIQKHNEQVKKNRYILSKIINCIRFCGAFELALRGHDESDSSNNPGIFRGLIDLVGSLDSEVKNHFDGSTNNSAFKGTSKTIQNELLAGMLEVCHEEIKKEIDSAKFVAIIADDITDVSDNTQTVLIFRYEYCGNVYERFWGFLNPNGQDADAISEVRPVIKNNDKVIAQSFDGAAVMSGRINGVQAKLKEVFSNARFIHCYAHQLNLIISQCASQNKGARVFFSSLEAIPVFFRIRPEGWLC